MSLLSLVSYLSTYLLVPWLLSTPDPVLSTPLKMVETTGWTSRTWRRRWPRCSHCVSRWRQTSSSCASGRRPGAACSTTLSVAALGTRTFWKSGEMTRDDNTLYCAKAEEKTSQVPSSLSQMVYVGFSPFRHKHVHYKAIGWTVVAWLHFKGVCVFKWGLTFCVLALCDCCLWVFVLTFNQDDYVFMWLFSWVCFTSNWCSHSHHPFYLLPLY